MHVRPNRSRWSRVSVVLAASLCLAAVVASVAAAADAYLGTTPPPKESPGPPYEGGGRVGGDTFADAVVMPSWLYTDTGNTCGFTDDWNEVCPYLGGTAPDVVYRYDCTGSMMISVDLCASSYDTKVSVYDGPSFANLIACNDDAGCGYSGYQSRIEQVSIEPGHSYYFVIDGYGNGCGDYVFSVTDVLPCVVECPEGSQQENEPPCVDSYYDIYNGGCQTEGWTPIGGDGDGCATMCGRSCTYSYQGLSYRDSDWYTATAAGGPVTISCVAEFPVLLMLIYATDCIHFDSVWANGGRCETATVTLDIPAGQEFWPWVGPSIFSGVPESNYVLHVCGLQANPTLGACCLPDGDCVMILQSQCQGSGEIWFGGPCQPNPCTPTPVTQTSWGRLKTLRP